MIYFWDNILLKSKSTASIFIIHSRFRSVLPKHKIKFLARFSNKYSKRKKKKGKIR